MDLWFSTAAGLRLDRPRTAQRNACLWLPAERKPGLGSGGLCPQHERTGSQNGGAGKRRSHANRAATEFRQVATSQERFVRLSTMRRRIKNQSSAGIFLFIAAVVLL